MEELMLDDNQIIMEDTDLLLPDDDEEIVEETTETVTEEVAENTDGTVEETIDFGDLEVKFLHETKKLKDFQPEEIKTLVQKGMNHDRVTEKLKANESIMEEFSEIAQEYGFDLDSLKDALYEQMYQIKADREGKTPNEVKLEHQLAKQTKVKNAPEKVAFEKLLESYPDVEADKIKPETWERFNSGSDLKTAYELQLKNDKLSELEAQLSQLQNEIKVTKQNENTKKKGVVKPTTTNGTGDIDDDFLSGLLGG